MNLGLTLNITKFKNVKLLLKSNTEHGDGHRGSKNNIMK